MSKKQKIDIMIKFDKMITFVSGRETGKTVFKEQIAPKIDNLDEIEKIVIMFPKNVANVSISFTKGLISELVERIGIDETYRLLDFKTSREKLDKKIREDILF